MTPLSNIQRFKRRAAEYWTSFKPEDFPNTFPTTAEQKNELRENFKNQYGKFGSKILNKLVTSEKLNGGTNPNRHKHFEGFGYSMPLGMYFMRRATGWSPDDAYKIFAHDVETVSNAENRVSVRVPTPKHVEKVCKSELDIMKEHTNMTNLVNLGYTPIETVISLMKRYAKIMNDNDPLEP